MVLVDSAFEGMRVEIGGKKTLRLGDDAPGREIPAPRERLEAADRPVLPAAGTEAQPLDPMFKALPPAARRLQAWAQALPQMEDAEASQREWSSEYFAKWLNPQAGTLGAISLLGLTRAEGGYEDSDVPAAQLERERKARPGDARQVSSNSRQVVLKSGHNMNLEAPEDVTRAVREVVEAARRGGRLCRSGTGQGSDADRQPPGRSDEELPRHGAGPPGSASAISVVASKWASTIFIS